MITLTAPNTTAVASTCTKRAQTTAARLALPKRVYPHHGAYRYVPLDGKPVNLGRDYREALRKYAALTNPAAEVGSLAALIDEYMVTVAPKKAPRTYEDNKKQAEKLKAALGHIPYLQLRPSHVVGYRDARSEEAPVQANRDLALLSHIFTTAMDRKLVEFNPCSRVRRNPEKARDRLIEDSEFEDVQDLAVESVQILMALIYRTCQRPSDLIRVGPGDIREIEHEGRTIRVLRIRQQKTGTTVDIIIAGELEEIVDAHLRAEQVHSTFVHTRQGKPYTYDGLMSMFKRYVIKARLKDMGVYDLKAKGATDMYRSGVPLERLQLLLGHKSIKTTEIYIRARLPDVSMPNMRTLKKKKKADGGTQNLRS